jgi:hypothetical protein
MGEISKQIEHLMVLAWTLYLLIIDIKDYSSIDIDSIFSFVMLAAAILISAVLYYLIGLFICRITRSIFDAIQKLKS